MTKRIRILCAKAAIILATIPLLVFAYEYGPNPGYTAAPGDNPTACIAAGCHVGTANSGPGSVKIGLPAGNQGTYVPGQAMQILVQITDSTKSAYGFQLTARMGNGNLTQSGDFSTTDANTQVLCADGSEKANGAACSATFPIEYIEHTLTGYETSIKTTTKGSYTYSMSWTPPASANGNVTLYVAANCGIGDPPEVTPTNVYTSNVTLTPAASAPSPVISGLSPMSATAGGPAFTLTVNGSGFVAGSNVEWNGSPVATSFLSATQLSASIPASLIASAASASVTVVNTGGGASAAVTFSVTSASANVLTISHIADGGGWRSSIILVNTDVVPALYSVSFTSDAGLAYSPPLALGAATGSIPVGGSAIIETADTASALSEGWAQVTSSQSLGGTAIFRYDPGTQEAAVPLLTTGGLKLEIPYQVGSGLNLGIALANPNATQTANLTEIIRDQSGKQLASRSFTLAALNHTAFNPTFPSTISGGGVVEYDSSVNIYALGIRSSPEGTGLAFTSLDAALPQPAATKTISHIADGGGWRSTIILVNTDTVPALYTVNFTSDAGLAYTPPLALGATTGTIPVGGSTIIETADTSSTLSEGWGQVTSAQSLGGTAIFRYDPWTQEAAVPLLTSGGATLKLPYQVGSGLNLGVALANPSATQTANLTEIIRDQSGNALATRNFTLAAQDHTAFNPTFPGGITGGGVVEYDSDVNIYALGIRSSPEGTGLAFTSVRAAYQ